MSLLSLSLDKNILNSCLNKIGRAIFQLVVYMWTTLVWKFSDSPVVGTHVFTTESLGSIPSLGTKIPQAILCCQKNKNKPTDLPPTYFAYVSITLMQFFIVQFFKIFQGSLFRLENWHETDQPKRNLHV